MAENEYKAPGETSKPVILPGNIVIEPKEGEMMDVAPFGEVRTWEEGKDIGVLWEDLRDIFKVTITFADAANVPDPSTAKVQYWRAGAWPKKRIPRDQIVGSGGSGWFNVGDWYQGVWQDADVELKVDGATWTYTFHPTNQKEVPEVEDFDGTWRATLKMRILFTEKAPAVKALNMFSDSTWHRTTGIVQWGGTAVEEQVWDGQAEAFNGYVRNIRPLGGGNVKVNGLGWTSRVKNTIDGVLMDVWYSKPVAVHSFDGTIVTIRSKQHSFSFSTKDLTEGKRIYVRPYGVLVQSAKEPATYEEVEQNYQNATKDLFRQIEELPEQTLPRAWSDMPRKGRIYMPLIVEGGRQHFGIMPNGDVRLDRRWNDRIKASDTDRVKWGWLNMYLKFGLPHGSKTGASRPEDGSPLAITWYEKDGVRYEQEAFPTPLAGKIPASGRIKAEDTQVCMLRFRLTNFTDKSKAVALPFQVQAEDKGKEPHLQELAEKDGLIYSNVPEDGMLLRMYVKANNAAKLTAQGTTVNCEVDIPARSTKDFYVHVSFVTMLTPEEIEQLKKLDYDEQKAIFADFWQKRLAISSQIKTPEPMINHFYKSHAAHLLLNSESEVGNDNHYMVKVGSFGYGAFTNESVMMTTDMNRRGYHQEVEKSMQSWIDYQSTVLFPGDYTDQDGVFYGAGGYEDGGYNQHHGWCLWGMAEHYWFTRDKAWLTRVAANLVKGCDWIIRQRSRTKTDECVGIRAIEYGLMPPGSLEDVADWRIWMSNNDFNYWGMNAVAKALVEINHPDGKRLLKEAADYREDIRKAFFEGMVRSPVVGLRDGSYIPSIPSEAHRRGRSFGWLTETLEGSIYLLRTGVIAHDEPVAEWIMKDYEDNRYLSDQFGYQIPFFERDWFSLGGFSQQPNLLCGPIPYMLRDEIKHYVRAYFNPFAAGYFPERAMITEHPLPNLGDYAGDHFKSSDEALNTSWVRSMFIWDEEDDLYLGRAIPRYWLADGEEIGIERAHTHFGEMSISLKSAVAKGSIEMTIDPPTLAPPPKIYARFRHPEGMSMNRVTVNGKPWADFDPEKEWVVLPALKEKTVVVAYYD